MLQKLICCHEEGDAITNVTKLICCHEEGDAATIRSGANPICYDKYYCKYHNQYAMTNIIVNYDNQYAITNERPTIV